MNIQSNSPPTADIKSLDLRHHWHPFTDHGALSEGDLRLITHADGPYIWEASGQKILDAMAGLWCVNVGYGRQEITDAVNAQMAQLPYYNTFFKTSHQPAAQLAEMLSTLTPENLDRIFFTGSGSESNDTILRVARTYWAAKGKPDKTTIISRKNAYHGSTMAGLSLGGMAAMHGQGGPLIPDIAHINQPYWYFEGGDIDPETFGINRAQELADTIDRLGEERVAAFIAEPVQGAGGVIIPPETYWPQIQKICDERKILLIADEVICGFGRLGEWFGSGHYDIRPDIISMAKGLSSGYLPIGAVAISAEIGEAIDHSIGEFTHGYTYSGHPTCAAAAIANLKILQAENIIENVRENLVPYFANAWAALGDHPLVGEARSRGMMAALELVSDKSGRKAFPNQGTVGTKCRDLAFANGIVMRAVRDTIIVSPPLILSHQQVDELIEKAWKTLDQTMNWINKQ